MPKLGLYSFATRLLDTNDLDPVYVVLWEAKLPPETLQKWLIAYWCFYHSGTASYIAESLYYWDTMRCAAASKEYPRCRERRHFRGAMASKSVAWLSQRGRLSLFRPLLDQSPTSVESIMKYVTTWYGFGNWIAFKVADMIERLQLRAVRFPPESINGSLYDSPRGGATDAWEAYGNGSLSADKVVPWAVESILEYLQDPPREQRSGPGLHSRSRGVSGPYLAPPSYDRPVGVQEAETILCKWHSYLGGHYHVGEDVEGLRRSLEFRGSGLGQYLTDCGRHAGLWQ